MRVDHQPADGRPESPLVGRLTGRLALLALLGFILNYFQAILVPLVFAVLLAFVLKPLVDALGRRQVPNVVSIIIAELVVTLPVGILVWVFLSSIGPFTEQLPKYQGQLVEQADQALNTLMSFVGNEDQRVQIRKQVTQNLLPRLLNDGATFVKDSAGAITSALGAFLLTLVFNAFILLEARRFHEKFEEAYGANHPLLNDIRGIGEDVRAYVVAKTLLGALTSLSVWIILELSGVDFAAVWGLVAFPLSFIPSVGAFVASVPPILLAGMDPSFSAVGVFGVCVGLLVVNGLIGTILDPRYVGQAVRLSPLVVFLSMLIWGILWGPVGMILAVPIMVSVKVICERVSSLEPIATFMRG